jgi:hypothetical protein
MNATFDSYDEKFNLSEMEINPIFQTLQGKRGLFQVTPNRASEMKVSDFKLTSESNEPKSDDFEKVDELFWKNLDKDSPLYAYDIPKTLFKNGVDWDMNNLENLLGYIRCEIPGVTTPYLYFGSWKSNFSWHVEDMNLYSISYLQFFSFHSNFSVLGNQSNGIPLQQVKRKILKNFQKNYSSRKIKDVRNL